MAEASHISAANALERGARTAMFQSGEASRRDDESRGRKSLSSRPESNIEPDIGR
jgi:hypothetical protein